MIIRSLVLARGDLRSIELAHFKWKDFYATEDLKPIWNVILGKSKRLMALNANFLVTVFPEKLAYNAIQGRGH